MDVLDRYQQILQAAEQRRINFTEDQLVVLVLAATLENSIEVLVRSIDSLDAR